MPFEVRNARFVSVSACPRAAAPKMYALALSAVGLILVPFGGTFRTAGWVIIGVGLVLAMALVKKTGRLLEPKIVVDERGFWCHGLPREPRVPFAAIAFSHLDVIHTETEQADIETAYLSVELKDAETLAGLMPGGAKLPRSLRIACNGLDVAPDDIARCLEGYTRKH